jgi:hypothetical protein
MTFGRLVGAITIALLLIPPSQYLRADQTQATPGPDIAVGEVYDYLGNAGGGTYQGEMRVTGKNEDGELVGEIDIKVATADGRHYTVRQDFALTQGGAHVEIRCFKPRAIEGHYFKYSSDHFVLVRAEPGVYKGDGEDRISQNGTAHFTVRKPPQ